MVQDKNDVLDDSERDSTSDEQAPEDTEVTPPLTGDVLILPPSAHPDTMTKVQPSLLTAQMT